MNIFTKIKIIKNLFFKKRLFFGEKMGYLVCQNCGGYYKLKEGESAEDFVACQCYGQLVYVESLEDIKENEEVQDKSVLKLNADYDHNNSSDFIVVNGDSEPVTPGEKEIDQDIDVKDDLDHPVEEPTVKNRAYYRRYDHYSKPDITYLKNLKDVPGLINALYYDDPNIKLEAAQALSVVGDDRALGPLNKIINHEGGSLKLYAEIAVKQIHSRKYGYQSHSRDDYRPTSTQPTESSESHQPIHNIPQEEVPPEKVSIDELPQKGVSEEKFPQERVSEDEISHEGVSGDEVIRKKVSIEEFSKVSEDKVIQEEISEDIVKTDTHGPVSSDISRIDDEKDVSKFGDEKDITLTDDEKDITPINHGKDLSTPDDEKVPEEIKNKPSAVKESDIKLVDDESLDEELTHNDSTDFEVSEPEDLKAETELLKELKTSNLEIPDDQKVEINIKSSEGIPEETNRSVRTNLISENKLSSETNISPEGNQSSESKKSYETKKSSEKISRKLPGKTPLVSMKTFDDTPISSDDFNNQPVPDPNNPGMIRNITGVFKNSTTPVPASVVNDKIVPPKPSPVVTNTTINDKKTDSFTQKEESTDKQIIGFIILFSIILIVGVILTMTQMEI